MYEKIVFTAVCIHTSIVIVVVNNSNVKSLGDVALLPVEDLVLRFSEVSHADLHSSFSQGDETRFGAKGLNIGTREVILRHNEFFKVDVGGQAHLARVNLENSSLRLFVREWELDLTINSTRSD